MPLSHLCFREETLLAEYHEAESKTYIADRNYKMNFKHWKRKTIDEAFEGIKCNVQMVLTLSNQPV